MKSRSPYALFIAVLVAIVIVLFAVWGYVLYRSFALRSEIAGIQEESDKRLAKENYLLSLKDVMRDSKNEVDLIKERFLGKDDIPKFIDMLENEAKNSNVKAGLGSINLEESDDPNAIRALRIHVGGSGEWKDVVGFVALLESLPYQSSIDSLSLSKGPASEKDKTVVWNFNADLVNYVIH